jgi:hypothetical protein
MNYWPPLRIIIRPCVPHYLNEGSVNNSRVRTCVCVCVCAFVHAFNSKMYNIYIGLTGHKYTLELVERKPTLPDFIKP